jgi:hypothetical protein
VATAITLLRFDGHKAEILNIRRQRKNGRELILLAVV